MEQSFISTLERERKDSMSALFPELVFYAGSTLLEGPHWHAEEGLLYCVSIEQNRIYAVNPETGDVTTYQTDGAVGCAVIDEKGMILEAEKDGIYQIDPETKEKSFVVHPESNPKMRYNDGKLDPRGRFLVGTMGYEEDYEGEGKLFSIEGSSARPIVTGTTTSNGLDWSPDGETFYFIDTPTNKIGQYAYDLETGDATFEKYVVEVTEDGFPDGMCVDKDGMIWVALYAGHKVCKWNPETGEKLAEIEMPAQNVTSCCIGGKNMDYLYVTTAQEDGKEEELAGGLFRVKLS